MVLYSLTTIEPFPKEHSMIIFCILQSATVVYKSEQVEASPCKKSGALYS